jgi:hypothetical protein
MTLNELKSDVAKLGFESYIEDEDCFIASANRALSLIYIDRPVSKSAVITFSGPEVSLAKEFIEHHGGETLTIACNGGAISFRSSGVGECVIRDSTGAGSVQLTGDRQLVKQFIRGDATVSFIGDYYFTISNLAVFKELLSNKPLDIPEYTPYRELDPSDYCNDFRAFSGMPCDKFGNPIDEVSLMDGRIRAPFNYRGELYLNYYRTPKKIDATIPNASIDVSEECAPMLPLLTASFLWLDDDAAKAQYYMSLYRDMIANTKRYSTNKIDTAYRVNGWA